MFSSRDFIKNSKSYIWKVYKKLTRKKVSIKYLSILSYDAFIHKYDFEIFSMTVRHCIIRYSIPNSARLHFQRIKFLEFLLKFYPKRIFLWNFIFCYISKIFFQFRNKCFFYFKMNKPKTNTFWNPKYYPYNIIAILFIAWFFYTL